MGQLIADFAVQGNQFDFALGQDVAIMGADIGGLACNRARQIFVQFFENAMAAGRNRWGEGRVATPLNVSLLSMI